MCEYCTNSQMLYNEPLIKFDESDEDIETGNVRLESGGLLGVFNTYEGSFRSINYCPMCGRKLEG